MPTSPSSPMPCGTMTQPFIDCAIKLAARRRARRRDRGDRLRGRRREPCTRLWEPLADKHRPPTPYAAKFSTPFCMAVGFFDREAGSCAVHRGAHPRSGGARARGEDPIRDQSRATNTRATSPATCARRSRTGAVREFRQPHHARRRARAAVAARSWKRSSWTTRATAGGADRACGGREDTLQPRSRAEVFVAAEL